MNEKKIPPKEEEEINSFGGYLTRDEYQRRQEKNQKSWSHTLYIALVAVLLLPAVLGIVSLIRGDYFPEEEPGLESDGTIRVPSQAQLSDSPKDLEEALKELDSSLVTVAAGSEDGTVRYGTGFIIAEEGYVLCSSNLVQENTAFRIYQEAFGYNAALAGVQKELGLALLKLDGAYGLTYVSAGNFTFVERGETLTAVGAVYGKEFLGTALSGNVAALDTVIRTGEGNLPISVPVAYLSVPPNASLWGAPCIDEAGNTVGICTDAIESPYGSLTAVVSINAVYTLVNEMLGSGVA